MILNCAITKLWNEVETHSYDKRKLNSDEIVERTLIIRYQEQNSLWTGFFGNISIKLFLFLSVYNVIRFYFYLFITLYHGFVFCVSYQPSSRLSKSCVRVTFDSCGRSACLYACPETFSINQLEPILIYFCDVPFLTFVKKHGQTSVSLFFQNCIPGRLNSI